MSYLAEETSFPEVWYDIADENHFWAYWRFKILQKLLLQQGMRFDKELLCFDIGAGNGILIKQLESSTRWKTDACDTNPRFENQIEMRGKYFQYNVYEKQPSLQGKYDVVFLMDIVEHLNNPSEFIDTASFYLKLGGVLVINVPAFQFLYSKYDVVVGHKMRYNRKSVKELINSNIFIVADIRYWGLCNIPLLLARKFFSLFHTNTDKIILRGMKPPYEIFNMALKRIADLENAIISYPCIGSSLMLVLRKKD